MEIGQGIWLVLRTLKYSWHWRMVTIAPSLFWLEFKNR